MSLVDVESACSRLNISGSWFRLTVRQLGLKPTKNGKYVFYSESQIQAIKEYFDNRKYENENLKKIICFLENVPAGYKATKEGLCKYIGKPRNSFDNLLINIDTVYEEKINSRVTLMGLTQNHKFISEETTEEEDEVIKSYCISNNELKSLLSDSLNQ